MAASIRSWRIAFLTLRDETLTSQSTPTLINHLIFSQSDALIAAAPALPPHEIHSLSGHVSLEFTSTSWVLVLESFGIMIVILLCRAGTQEGSINNDVITSIKQCLESLRCLFSVYQRTLLLSEVTELLNLLLNILSCSHELIYLSISSGNQRFTGEYGKRIPGYNSLREIQATSFTMISEVFSRAGTYLQVDNWQSTIEQFDQVAGFVAVLKMFLNYGLTSKSQTLMAMNLCFTDHESSTVDLSSDSDYSDSDVPGKDAYNICCRKARVAAIICIQDLCRADPKSFTSQWTMLLPSTDVLQQRKYEVTLMTCLLFDPYLKARITSALTLATMLDGPASIFLQVAECKESTKCGSFMALSSTLGQILMQLHAEHHRCCCGIEWFWVTIAYRWSGHWRTCSYSRMPTELLPTIISSLQSRVQEGFLSQSDQTGLLATAMNCLTAALSAPPSSLKVKDMFTAELAAGFLEDQGKTGVLSTLFRLSKQVTVPAVGFEALQALRSVAHNYPSIMVLCWEQVTSVVHGFLKPSSPEGPIRWKVNEGTITVSNGEKITVAAIKVLDECLRAISGFEGTEDLDDKLLDGPFTSDYVKMKTISSAPAYGSRTLSGTQAEPEARQSMSEPWSEVIEKHMPLILWHTSPMVRSASVTCFAGLTSSAFFSLAREKQCFILTSSISAALDDEVPSVRSAACRAIGVISCFPQISQSPEILDKFIHAAEINTHDPLVSVRITASWALANMCDSLRHCINSFCPTRFSVDSDGSSPSIALLVDCALRLTKDGDKIKANSVRALGNLSRFLQLSSQSGFHDEPMEGMSLSLNTGGTGKLSASHNGKNSHVQLPPLEDYCWLDKTVQAFLSCVTTGNVKVQWNVCHALSNLFLNETLKLRDMDWAPSVFSILLLLLRDSSNSKIRIQAAAALAVPATIVGDLVGSLVVALVVEKEMIAGVGENVGDMGDEPGFRKKFWGKRGAVALKLLESEEGRFLWVGSEFDFSSMYVCVPADSDGGWRSIAGETISLSEGPLEETTGKMLCCGSETPGEQGSNWERPPWVDEEFLKKWDSVPGRSLLILKLDLVLYRKGLFLFPLQMMMWNQKGVSLFWESSEAYSKSDKAYCQGEGLSNSELLLVPVTNLESIRCVMLLCADQQVNLGVPNKVNNDMQLSSWVKKKAKGFGKIFGVSMEGIEEKITDMLLDVKQSVAGGRWDDWDVLDVVGASRDYGISFSDIVQGLEHVLENLSSDQILSPSSFKYRVALEKQVKPL
ncbi:hypothetical protein RJ639_012504 [Escallonia herrerae]|uniref:DUF4042 domain-containing protein n=1 Tax=Escallonia herrerae TaxID=1293975 RepID=A0AA89ARP3_9ASTE|nr:hypothetical protein RJ639_012504 [Escallonia herrerae]